MPYFILTIENDPAAGAIRAQNVEAHRAYLQRCADRILIGGAILDEDESQPEGSIYVVEADNLDEARRFADEDPLTVAKTRRAITIRPWRQALFDRAYVLGTPAAGAPFPR